MTIKNRHVLVVEGDQPSREALAIYLTKMGCDVSTALDEEEILKTLDEASQSNNEFDIIFADILMTESEGDGFLKYLKISHPNTKIIATSSKEMHSEASSLGVSFLEKPLQPNRLLAAMSSAMLSRSHC